MTLCSYGFADTKVYFEDYGLIKYPTRMGFEPTRAEPNGLAVHRLNHSATSSCVSLEYDR